MNAMTEKIRFAAGGHCAGNESSSNVFGRLANAFWRSTIDADAGKHALNARWHADANTSAYLFPLGQSVLVGRLSDQTAPLRRLASECRADLMVIAPKDVRLDMVADCAALMDFCMIEEAAFDSVEDMVDFCLLVRGRCPDIPLVILSRSSRRDDLTLTRAPICDATLCAPTSEAALINGLKVARQNARERRARH